MLIGVVGKPNVGKSTFFRAATLAEAEIANYPFATIKPNHGIGFVRVSCVDKEFGRQCTPRSGYCIKGIRYIGVQMIDVAGLVPGAHEGKGKGNQFLDDLNQADVLIHVIDVSGSTNEKGEVVEALSYDPAEDVIFLEHELNMWYLRILRKGWEKFARTIVQEKQEIHKALAAQLSGLSVTEQMIKDALKELGLEGKTPNLWSESELASLTKVLRVHTKPMIIACNKIDVSGAFENYERLKKMFPQYSFIACSAESELALREATRVGLIDYAPGSSSFSIPLEEKLSEKQKKALHFISEQILKKYSTTGVQDVLDKAVFELLKYIAIFPGGVNKLEDKDGRVLPDCFLLRPKSTALDFAYKLHTDLGKHFIRAIDVRAKKTVGKDFELHHRDVIEIVSGK